MRNLWFLFLCVSCDAVFPPIPVEPAGDGKVIMLSVSSEEADIRKVTEGFLRGLKEKSPQALREFSSVGKAFRSFLPPNFDSTNKEDAIASLAIQSTDPRIQRISQSSFFTYYPSDTPNSFIVVLISLQETLSALEITLDAGTKKVTRVGSDSFGEQSDKFVIDSCSSFAAPFKVPKGFSSQSSFDACSKSLKAFEAEINAQEKNALQKLDVYLQEQPFIIKQKENIVTAAQQQFGKGDDKKAFEYGRSEGEKLRYQFLMGLQSYCTCLPPETQKDKRKE